MSSPLIVAHDTAIAPISIWPRNVRAAPDTGVPKFATTLREQLEKANKAAASAASVTRAAEAELYKCQAEVAATRTASARAAAAAAEAAKAPTTLGGTSTGYAKRAGAMELRDSVVVVAVVVVVVTNAPP